MLNISVFLLFFHIAGGVLALASAATAIFSEKGKRIHIKAGKTYFWSMLVIFVTAIPLAILASNLFLFLISIFSFYLAFSGRRFARNRSGIAERIDYAAVFLMLFAAIGMWVLGIFYFLEGNTQYIVLGLFGLLSLLIGFSDLSCFRSNAAKGKKRISKHLTNMLGGTIAVVTAVLVVNVDIEPEWIVWVLPSVVITPVIFWWNVKVLGKQKRQS